MSEILKCVLYCVDLHIPLNSCHPCLQHERGVHRIQRVPVTESHGRLHTSTSVVVVLPQPEDVSATEHFKLICDDVSVHISSQRVHPPPPSVLL